MHILPIKPKTPVTPEIKYRRMLNRLNLEVRERIETLKFYEPFDTLERENGIKAIKAWKESQKADIYDRCFNPQPSFIQRVRNIFKK